MLVILSALVLAALPFFMIGGLAVQIRDDLGLSEAALGAAITIGFVTGASTAPFGGRIADRIGPKAAVYLGAALSTISLLGLGLAVNGWTSLVTLLCVGNLSIALIDPGLAILVGRATPGHLHGLAFGIKEASVPTATLLAGVAVPTIALTVGWRWAFALGIVPLSVVVLLLPRLVLGPSAVESAASDTSIATNPAPPRSAIVLAAVAAALGTTAASGAGIFVTESAVAMGISPAGAGILLATGSIAGIITRVATGIRADRTVGPLFGLIAVMLGVGAATMALGGTGNSPLLVVATIGAFSGGWGWTGIYFLSLVRTNPRRPGSVAGIGTASLGVGNAAGPILFGLVAGSISYRAAWVGAAVAAVVASGLMSAARQKL
jgi:MFS family permease